MAVDNREVVLRLDQVTKKIRKQTIVNQLSFEVNTGEIVGLLGPNGAGKTTTIRMIVGLIQMTSGDVTIKGKSIRNEFEQAIRHVGAIVENPEFYPYMTGLDNLKQYQRMTSGVTDERLDQVINIVGLKDAMKKKVKSYSLGMRQRLGIAQALLHSPKVMILDEPTNGLDPAGIREMRDYLKKIAAEENIAVLVSSHLLSEMELMCNRVVIIQKGQYIGEEVLEQSGTKHADVDMTCAIRVSNVVAAEQFVKSIDYAQYISTDSATSEFVIKATDEAIARLNSELNKQNILVYRITEVKRSLEDEFLARTGGNQIV